MNTKPCPPGKVRNPKTNRCKKIEKTSPSKKKTLKSCPPGKVRNPKTNRCKNVEKTQTKGKPKPKTKGKPKTKSKTKTKHLKPCPPGKVRNPMTNRCKKASAPEAPAPAAPVSKYFEKQWEKFNTQMKGGPDIKDALVKTPEEASPVQETPQTTEVPPLEKIVDYYTSQKDFMEDYAGKSYAFCLNSNDEFVSDEECKWFKDFQDALEHLRTRPGQYRGLYTDPSYFTIYICNLENGKELRENSTEIAKTTEVSRGDWGMQGGPGVEGAEDSGYPKDISKFKIKVNTYAKELPPNELQNKEIYVWEENEGDHQYASVTQPDNDESVEEVILR